MAVEPVRRNARATREVARMQSRGRRPPRAGMGYTRFVTLMKITLPMIAAVLVSLIVVWPQFKEVREGFRIEIARLNLSTGGQRANNARYTGTDAQGRPFNITAEAAMQDEGEPGIVKLDHPKADITLTGGSWVAAHAVDGAFHRVNQMLNLSGGVSVFHDAGFEIHSPTAKIDVKLGTAEGDERVDGHGPAGTIAAAGFRVLDNGTRVIFNGPAKLTLRPQAGATARR